MKTFPLLLFRHDKMCGKAGPSLPEHFGALQFPFGLE